MVLKRELSQPSPAATPARKLPRLVTQDIPLSTGEVSTPPTTIASPADTEHAPSPPSYNDPYYAPQPQTFFHVQPAQLVARLEEMTKQYEDAVDEAAVHVDRLRRQVSDARRQLESTPSWEQPPFTQSLLPVSYNRTAVWREFSTGSIDGAGRVEGQGETSVEGAGAANVEGWARGKVSARGEGQGSVESSARVAEQSAAGRDEMSVEGAGAANVEGEGAAGIEITDLS